MGVSSKDLDMYKITQVLSFKSNLNSSTWFRTSRILQTPKKHGGMFWEETNKKEKSETKWRHSSAENILSSVCTRPKRRLMTWRKFWGGDAPRRSDSSSSSWTTELRWLTCSFFDHYPSLFYEVRPFAPKSKQSQTAWIPGLYGKKFHLENASSSRFYISQYISDTCFKAPTHSSEETVQYFAKNLESSNFFDEFILS